MPYIQAIIGSVADNISGAVRDYGIRTAKNESGQGYSRAVSELENTKGENRQAYAPWMSAGRTALDNISARAAAGQNINATGDPGYRQVNTLQNPGQFSFNTTGENVDPSYRWRLNQGLAAVEKSAAARGGFFSGNTGTALNDYAQGAASQEYANQFSRYNTTFNNYMQQEGFNADQYGQAFNRQQSMDNNTYNRLAGIADMGYGATNQFASGNQNAGYNLATMYKDQGLNSADWTMQQYGNAADTNSSIASRWSGNNMFSNMKGGNGYGGFGGK